MRLPSLGIALAVAALTGCGGDDDGEVTRAQEQAARTPAKSVICSHKTFRVAFNPNGVSVTSGDDTLATASPETGTVSGRCTLAPERFETEEAALSEPVTRAVTVTCTLRRGPHIRVRPGDGGGTTLDVAVPPQVVVTARVGGAGAQMSYSRALCERGSATGG